MERILIRICHGSFITHFLLKKNWGRIELLFNDHITMSLWGFELRPLMLQGQTFKEKLIALGLITPFSTYLKINYL
jgi:hypothetical protein